ncbi:MAG: hypothetical protein M3220_07815, partial [Chloroflexota bacterium]|nr:hypothetical protein [Chloroflexota bacterium]
MRRQWMIVLMLALFVLTACARMGVVPESIPPPAASATPVIEEPALSNPTPTQVDETATVPPAAMAPLLVAFTQEDSLWLWSEESGEARPLTGSAGIMDLEAADDGEIIAFRRGDGLWAINRDGTNERELVSLAGQGSAVSSYGWVPGTHTLAFNTQRVSSGAGFFPNHDLHLVDANTLEITELLLAGEGGNFHYSPDGRQIAIVTPGRIDLIDSDGTNRRPGVLTFTPPITYGEAAHYARPLWARDGSALLVAVPPPDPFVSGDSTTIWRIPVDGSESTSEGTLQVAPFSGPALSPDMTRVVYLHSSNAGAPPHELHVAQLGNEPTVYHPEATAIIGWAPDGEHFIFEAGNDGTSNRLFLGRVGAEAVPLFDTGEMVIDLRWVDE